MQTATSMLQSPLRHRADPTSRLLLGPTEDAVSPTQLLTPAMRVLKAVCRQGPMVPRP